MKLKYYLRGLGIGIIVTTVILAVSFSKKEIKMSDEEIMARAAQLGMVMQETETTEQGDTEQDPDGTDTGAKTEVVTEQTASELLEERTAAEETAQNTEAAAEDVAAEAQENSANTDEETQAQQEAADAENPSGVYRLVIQKGDVCRIVCEKLAENGVISDAETFRQYLSQIGYASICVLATTIFLTVCRMRKLQKFCRRDRLKSKRYLHSKDVCDIICEVQAWKIISTQ